MTAASHLHADRSPLNSPVRSATRFFNSDLNQTLERTQIGNVHKHRSSFETTQQPKAMSFSGRIQQSLNRWLKQNIVDKSVQSATTARARDGVLDRSDMLFIFRKAADRGEVNREEWTDLKTIVKNGKALGMQEPVQNLARKVVLGDQANRKYQGQALGNLRPYSSSAHLNKLVDKWFFGGDRPAAQSGYQWVSTPLFQNGISYRDIAQGGVGDCFFLSSLGALALQKPQQIKSMFTDNGDGTYTVRFYKPNGAADYVTVDRFLPANANGQRIYASYAADAWVALAEKAYAQWNESNVAPTSTPDNNKENSYQGIHGGFGNFALTHVSGKAAVARAMPASPDTPINLFNAGHLVTFGSKAGLVSQPVVEAHVYTLLGYDATTQKFKLYNPWGVDQDNGVYTDSNPDDGQIELTWTEMNTYFDEWYATA